MVLRGYSAWQLELFGNEENVHFFLTSTHILESVYVQGDTISSCMSTVNTKMFGFIEFVLFRENNEFAEFMVHLIHRKRVPLLHNTVLILCDEGVGLLAVEGLYSRNFASEKLRKNKTLAKIFLNLKYLRFFLSHGIKITQKLHFAVKT